MADIDWYFSKTTKSRELWEKSRMVLPGGVPRNWHFYKPYPIFISHADGSKIYDVDGNEYIDYDNNAGALILGHNHPKIVSAIKNWIETGILVGVAPTETVYKYAEKICSANPIAEQIRFTTCGSEAVMFATRLARAYTKRKKIAKFEGHYIGHTDLVYYNETPSQDTPEPPVATPDSMGIPIEIIREYCVSLPWNDEEKTEKIIKTFKDELAAVVVDPCMRAIAPPKEGFIKFIREVTEKYDVLLIFDEVVSGFRLSYRGAYGYFGVTPDIVVYGKVIGGGFPIGAFASSREIMKLVDPEGDTVLVPHSGTFSAHVFAVAAGYETLNILSSAPEIYDKLNRYGDLIRNRLTELFNEYNIPAIASGYASIFRIFFTHLKRINNYRDALSADKKLNNRFKMELLKRGVFFPKLWYNISNAISDYDLKYTFTAFEEAIHELGKKG